MLLPRPAYFRVPVRFALLRHPGKMRKPVRIEGIDAFRYLLSYLVVLLHSLPNPSTVSGAEWPFWFAVLCRGAVPFFFVASGYFMKPGTGWQTILKPAMRLIPIYLCWRVIYAAVAMTRREPPIWQSWTDFVRGNEAFHLWFLPALGIALAVVSFGIGRFGYRITGAVCCALMVCGLAVGIYYDIVGPPAGPLRGGILTAPFMVFVGALLAKYDFRIGRGAALACVAGAIFLVAFEESMIAAATGTPLVSHDFSLPTFALGAALLLVARDLPDRAIWTGIARLGAVSLTVYTSHLLFINLLVPLLGNTQPLPCLALSLCAFIMATLAGLSLRCIPWLRPIVR